MFVSRLGRNYNSTLLPWIVAFKALKAATLTALGFQTVLSSFFLSILGMRRK